MPRRYVSKRRAAIVLKPKETNEEQKHEPPKVAITTHFNGGVHKLWL